MNQSLRDFIIARLPLSIKSELNRRTLEGLKFYYSQEGEDILLDRFFSGMNDGFFVDVGAHHPLTFSNTHKFFLKGWRGINIDATPGSMIPFNQMRPNDINIEIGISDTEGELTYYMFKEPALNTFSKERVDFLHTNSPYKLASTAIVKIKPLQQVLKENLPLNQKIDFLSVDVEGLDYTILLSNDWDTYRPRVVLIEELDSTIEDIFKSNSYKFLHSKGYEFFSKTYNTVFFRDIRI